MTPESPSLGPPSTGLRITVFALGCAALLTGSPMGRAMAGEPMPSWPDSGLAVQIVRAVDGDTLRTAEGRDVRLAGLSTARVFASRQNEAARRHLAALSEGRAARLHFERSRQDRHGRLLAQVVIEDGPWLQAALVTAGLGRVETTAETAAYAAPLLQLEAQARQAGHGLWAYPAYRVIAPQEAGRRVGTFQLIEGTAQAIEGKRASSRFALAAGDSALTVSLNAAVRGEWRQSGIDWRSLLGRPLRIRGWLRWQDGPVIDVSHAAQIERLD